MSKGVLMVFGFFGLAVIVLTAGLLLFTDLDHQSVALVVMLVVGVMAAGFSH